MPRKRQVYKSHVKKKQKKSGGILKVTLIILLIALLVAGSYLAYLYYVGKKAADKAYDNNGRVKSELRTEQVKPLEDNISILFAGVDDSEKRGQGNIHSRSDSLMLATLNNKDHSVKLLSIPRDSYVYIPAFKYQDKITHAHTDSTGILSTIDSVENLLNIPVDYYFELNFDAFIQIVDALDGIEVDVPYKLDELDENDKRTVHLQPGVQTLNGREALALARTRHYDDDFKRGERQQMILEAIAKKATSVSSFTKYDALLTAIGDNMTTNMKFDEMKSFFSYLKGGMPKISSLKLEGTNDMSTGVYYFKLNDESVLNVRQQLQKQLGLTPDQSLDSHSNKGGNASNSTTTNATDGESTTTDNGVAGTKEQSENPSDGSYSNYSGNSNGGQNYSSNSYSDNN